MIPAGILFIAGFAFLLTEGAVEIIVPAVLILICIRILLRQFFQRSDYI